MLYSLLFPLADHVGAFNLFRYITFRTGGAVMTALLVSFVARPAPHPLAARRSSARASRSGSTAPRATS